jgi:hypothetical protein
VSGITVAVPPTVILHAMFFDDQYANDDHDPPSWLCVFSRSCQVAIGAPPLSAARRVVRPC